MTALALACSRLMLFIAAGLFLLGLQWMLTVGVFVEGLRVLHAHGSMSLLALAVAQAVLGVAAIVGASDLVRIGSVSSTNVAAQVGITLFAWALPAIAFIGAFLAHADANAVLLWQLVTVVVVTAGTELFNQMSDAVLIPSPGRSVARAFAIFTLMK